MAERQSYSRLKKEERMHSQIHVSQAEFVPPPQCPHCGGQMRLVPIVNDSSGHGMRTFECPLYQHDQAAVVRFG